MQLSKTKCLELINSRCDFLPRKYRLKDIGFYQYYSEHKNKHYRFQFGTAEGYIEIKITNLKSGTVRMDVDVFRIDEDDMYHFDVFGSLIIQPDNTISYNSFNKLKAYCAIHPTIWNNKGD